MSYLWLRFLLQSQYLRKLAQQRAIRESEEQLVEAKKKAEEEGSLRAKSDNARAELEAAAKAAKEQIEKP
jgi:hypothetical protein